MASWQDIFGFRVKDKTGGEQIPSVVPPNKNDGSLVIDTSVVSGGWQGYAYDIDNVAKTENEQIRRYRETSIYPEVDSAIIDIVNECIVSDQDDYPVKLELDNLKISDPLKDKFQAAFIEILDKLEFNLEGHDIFRKWYVDGKIYFHILFKNSDVRQGIAELRMVDPMKIKKVRNIKKKNNGKGVEVVDSIDEYYIYNDKGISETALSGIKLTSDSVVMAHSGVVDSSGLVVGFLNKAIKPANQLKMLEDAIVIYTITRAPDRRVFYIDVGNLPKIKAEQYVTDVMNKFKNKLVYNASTGEIADAKKHVSMIEDFWMPRRDGCLAVRDTSITLLDGREATLETLIAEFESGKENWTYSVSPEGTVVPGLITWAGITHKNATVLDITLDNGEVITATPDHKFILRDGTKIRAEHLIPGSSLMPFNTKKTQLQHKDYGNTYTAVQQNDTNEWTFAHRMVSSYMDRPVINGEVVHHVDFDRYNNDPSNLRIMTKLDHFALHSSVGRMNWSGDQTQHRARLSASGKAFFETEAGQARKLEIAANNLVDERIIGAFTKGRETIKEMREADKLSLSHADYLLKWSPGFTSDISQQGNAKIAELRDADKLSLTSAEYKEKWSGTYRNANAKYASYDLNAIKVHLSKIVYPKITDGEIRIAAATVYPDLKNKFDSLIRRNGYTNISEFMVRNFDGMSTTRTMKVANPAATNHKVVSVIYRSEKMDVGTLTVDGNNLHHDYHNFALTSGVFVMNSKGTEITTLQGASSLITADFVAYFQNKLYQSLNVPIGRMKPETGFSLGRSSEVTREELKFGKFVARLRLRFSSLFHDLLRIQLIAKSLIRADEWETIRTKIRYDFIRDNHFTELKETELLSNRITVLQTIDPYLGKYYSKAWIMKNVLMLADDEIVVMDKEIKKEGEVAIPTEISNQITMMKIQQEMTPEPEPEQAPDDGQAEPQQNQDLHAQKMDQNAELHAQKLKQSKGKSK